jgi:casein kinase 1
MLADQMLNCLEFMHSMGYVHRDIKPDNFLMGRGQREKQVFLIDYGLAKNYREIPEWIDPLRAKYRNITGTARYCSIGALKGQDQFPKDDLESLGYVWVYLLKGDLPWMGQDPLLLEDKVERICELKERITIESLCDGLPDEFIQFFHSVRGLQPDEVPPYSVYRQAFRDLFLEKGYVYDCDYCWKEKLPILASPTVSDFGESGSFGECLSPQIHGASAPEIRVLSGCDSPSAMEKRHRHRHRSENPLEFSPGLGDLTESPRRRHHHHHRSPRKSQNDVLLDIELPKLECEPILTEGAPFETCEPKMVTFDLGPATFDLEPAACETGAEVCPIVEGKPKKHRGICVFF